MKDKALVLIYMVLAAAFITATLVAAVKFDWNPPQQRAERRCFECWVDTENNEVVTYELACWALDHYRGVEEARRENDDADIHAVDVHNVSNKPADKRINREGGGTAWTENNDN